MCECLNEMLDYIGYVPENDDSGDEDYYFDYDRGTAYIVSYIKSNLECLEKI